MGNAVCDRSVVNADPMSAAVNGLFGAVNHITDTRCQFLLECIDRTSQNSELILPESNKPAGYLT